MVSKLVEGLDFLNFLFSDPFGGLHCMEESAENLEGHLGHGFGVDGSSIVGMNSISASDLILMPEIETMNRFNVRGEEIGVIWCHGVMKNKDGDIVPHTRDVRSVLRRVTDDLENSLNLKCEMFSEIEFYILNRSTGRPIDDASYLDVPPKDKSAAYRQILGRHFEGASIPVKRIHHEVGPGQNEVELQLQDVQTNCDDTLLGLWIADMLADRDGLSIVKDPLPLKNLPGNGLHQHILLKDAKTGENMMKTQGPEPELSATAYHFVAGMLKHASEITSIFATSGQSYDRLTLGHESPNFATWDYSNRQALVRVPMTSPDKMRVEFRGGDFSGSVHLLCASILAAGMDGIKQGLECPPNVKDNIHVMSPKELNKRGIKKLPQSFSEAATILENSEFVHNLLGDGLSSVLLNNAKRQLRKGRWLRRLF